MALPPIYGVAVLTLPIFRGQVIRTFSTPQGENGEYDPLKTWFLGFFTKIFNFWIFFCQNDSKYSSFEIFGVNFGVLSPAPYFLAFHPKKCQFWISYQKDSKYFSFEMLGVIFCFFAPGTLFLLAFCLKIFKFEFFTKRSQNSLVLRYSWLIFGFWPLANFSLGFDFFTKKTQNILVLRYSGLIFGCWPLAPHFLGFHLNFFYCFIFHRKGLKNSSKIFEVNFRFLAPSPLFFRISPKKFQILNSLPKRSKTL